VDVPIVQEEDPDGKKMAMGVTELGKLRVVVEKARNLPDADWGFMGMGKSDPYVRLGVGMQVRRAMLYHVPRKMGRFEARFTHVVTEIASGFHRFSATSHCPPQHLRMD
jgi:hypothetical protein